MTFIFYGKASILAFGANRGLLIANLQQGSGHFLVINIPKVLIYKAFMAKETACSMESVGIRQLVSQLSTSCV